MNRLALAAATVFALTFLAGCTGGGAASVTGKVTYRGKPLTTGTVYLAGPDGVQAASAINPDGTYQMFAVAAGPVKIGVISLKPQPVRGRPAKQAAGAPPPAPPPDVTGWVEIPEKHADPLTSGLTTDLKSGANEYDIELP